MERPWLKSYPAGMPADIELGEQDTLVTVFDDMPFPIRRIKMLFQRRPAFFVADQRSVRTGRHGTGQAAGMVGLGMVADDIVDLGQIGQRRDPA